MQELYWVKCLQKIRDSRVGGVKLLTTVQVWPLWMERGKEGGSGRKSLRLQHCSEEAVAGWWGAPSKACPLEESHGVGWWPSFCSPSMLSHGWKQPGETMIMLWILWQIQRLEAISQLHSLQHILLKWNLSSVFLWLLHGGRLSRWNGEN